jgi:hypothetical protein
MASHRRFIVYPLSEEAAAVLKEQTAELAVVVAVAGTLLEPEDLLLLDRVMLEQQQLLTEEAVEAAQVQLAQQVHLAVTAELGCCRL